MGLLDIELLKSKWLLEGKVAHEISPMLLYEKIQLRLKYQGKENNDVNSFLEKLNCNQKN